MTCPSPEVIREHLDGFVIERWEETRGGRPDGAGEPHHFHLIEIVAAARAVGERLAAAGGTPVERGALDRRGWRRVACRRCQTPRPVQPRRPSRDPAATSASRSPQPRAGRVPQTRPDAERVAPARPRRHRGPLPLAREAELRVRTLRMVIEERLETTRGEK